METKPKPVKKTASKKMASSPISPSVSQTKAISVKLSPESNPNLKYVTSRNLLRLKISEDQKPKPCKITMSDSDFTELTIIGLRFGCTWDEVLRGIIAMQLSGVTPSDGLENFIPALQ